MNKVRAITSASRTEFAHAADPQDTHFDDGGLFDPSYQARK
jgi:hypothetical protein